MESPGSDGRISFLDSKFSLNSDHTIHISVCRKPSCMITTGIGNLTSQFQPKSSHSGSHLHSKNVCFTAEILAKEMDYLYRILLKTNYPDWIIKDSEKKPTTTITNPCAGLEVNKNIFTSVQYVSSLSEEFRRIFEHTSVQVIFKGGNTHKSILMHPKDKIPSYLKQNTM